MVPKDQTGYGGGVMTQEHSFEAGADARSVSLMEAVARYIETRCDETVTLAELGEQAGLSPAHLQRRFKREMGVSPKAYHAYCRERTLKRGLREGDSVTAAVYEAGYGSASRGYEREGLGMTPGDYRAGGKGLDIAYASGATSWGPVMIGATERGVCFLHFEEREEALFPALRKEFPKAELRAMPESARPAFEEWIKALNAYLDGARVDTELPLDPKGTPFQVRVWTYLRGIPPGRTASYAEVAEGMGSPGAARAVAGACARNRIAVAVPCHRVIRGDGKLAGYRWGIEKKRKLLNVEMETTEGA